MLADGADVRFVDENGNLLDHYLQTGMNSGNTKIWVKAQTLIAGQINPICMYYGYVPYLDNPVTANLPTDISSRDLVFSETTPAERYVVNSTNAVQLGSSAQLASYENGNTVVLPDASTQVLSENQVISYPTAATALSQTTAIATTGVINLNFDANGGDNLVPVNNSGTQFVYRMDRFTNTFSFISPWCSADIEVRNQLGNLVSGGSFTIPTGGSNNLTTNNNNGNGLPNDGVVIIESTNSCPILATHSTTNDQDSLVMFPSAEEWYGVGSGSLQLAAATDNTTITVYDSNGGTNSFTLNRGDETTLTSPGSQGTEAAYRVVADQPVGASAIADGDGTEKVTFFPLDELGYSYILPADAQYVAVATQAGFSGSVEYYTPSDVCGDGTPDGGSVTVNSTGNFPEKAYFGSTSSGPNIPAGSCIVADVPFYAYYEDAATEDERNVWGEKQNRQFSYPQPGLSIGTLQAGSYTLGEPNTWSGRFPVTFTNNSSQTLTNYTIALEVSGNASFFSNLQSFGEDFRWAGPTGDGSDNLEYWVEEFDSAGQEAKIWVRFPGPIPPAATETLYAYVDATTPTGSTGDYLGIFRYPSPEVHYYPVDDTWIAGTNQGVSGTPSNSINDSNSTSTIGFQSFFSLPLGSTLLSADSFATTNPISGTFTADNTDAIAPLAFAGREFTSYVIRGNQEFDFYAPFGTANVAIFESTTSGWSLLTSTTVNSGQHVGIAEDITDNSSLRISSTQPIIAKVYSQQGDSQLLYPTESGFNERTGEYVIHGIGSSNMYISAISNNTNITIYRSDGTQTTALLNNSNDFSYSESGSGGQGSALAYTVVADGPIAGSSIADGDGTETVAFWGDRELSKTYVLPFSAQYLSIASPADNNTCRVVDAAGFCTSTDGRNISRPTSQ
jgi:hypothetical protein